MISNLGRRAARYWRRTAFVLDADQRYDVSFARSEMRKASSERRDLAIIIPTSGMGNIGDEALLESTLQNVPESEKLVVLPQDGSYPAELLSRYGAQSLTLPGLLTGGSREHRLAVRRLLAEVGRAKSLYVVGADVMDGGYNPREAVLRFSVLRASEILDVNTVVTGFSWNGRPADSVVRAASKLVSTRLLARDPLSFDRFSALDLTARVEQSADIVFCLQTTPAKWGGEPWAVQQRSDGRRIVVLNASGLLLQNRVLLEQYCAAANNLIASGFSLILVPHVVREGDSDVKALRAVRAGIADGDRVYHVERKLTVSQVHALASEAYICITARMHLAIISLKSAVPVIVIETQGKVAGLMKKFNIEFATVQPGVDAMRTIADAIDTYILHYDEFRTSLREVASLAFVEARRNFEDSADSLT